MYRLVPQKRLRWFQLATLVVTAIVGAAVWVAPDQGSVRLTTIEQVIRPVYFGAPLVILSLTAIVLELWVAKRGGERWLRVVLASHMFLAGFTFALAAIALVGVSRQWWAFGGPALGIYLTAGHLLYIHEVRRA